LFISIIVASAQTGIVINEFLTSNVLIFSDEAGEYDDWIELYNDSDDQINIAGMYISDDKNEPDKWQVPSTNIEKTLIVSKGFLVLWADDSPEQGALHLPFKLSESEEIYLFDSSFSPLDSIKYSKQKPDITYGRYPDGNGQLGYSIKATPGFSNSSNYQEILEPPSFNVSSGLYQSSVELQITSTHDSIYYTLDGYDPDKNSILYSGPFQITKTSTLKARALNNSGIGEIKTAIYFINEKLSLPVWSVLTDPDNLFGISSGIYSNPLESGREWERRVELKYIDNQLKIAQGAGLRIQGNSGRELEKKSFRLYFRKGYGASELEYNYFDHSSINSFENLILRAGYDDDLLQPFGTLLRDPVINELWRRTGNLTSNGRFSLLYLNNDFWGIYDVREDINDHFIRDYTGYEDFDMIRLRWNFWEVDYGDSLEWKSLISFFDENTFSSDSMLSEVNSRLDLENFTDIQAFYHLAQ